MHIEKINTNFDNNKIPNEVSQCITLSVILIDSALGTGYYPQVFLEEGKHAVKEKKMPEYITDDIEISSDSDREHSDEKNPNKENSDEEN